MNISKSELESAVEEKILTADQAKKLWDHFQSSHTLSGKFQAIHVLYYFAGILILASMTWCLTRIWEQGLPLMILSGVFASLYLILGNILWKKDIKIPGGLLITAAVGLTPVFIYGLQKLTGPWLLESNHYFFELTQNWIFMGVGTVIAALIALRFWRFPFITLPLSISLWLVSIDLSSLIIGKDALTDNTNFIVSCIFGLIILICSYFIDRKFKKEDFAFWTYLFGLLTLWSALMLMHVDSKLYTLFLSFFNTSCIFLSIYLRRKVFLIFGALGLLLSLVQLAWDFFKDSYAFPLVIALLGLATLFIGIKYKNNKNKLKKTVENWIPKFLIRWRPKER